jgi:hypothetical protein
MVLKRKEKKMKRNFRGKKLGILGILETISWMVFVVSLFVGASLQANDVIGDIYEGGLDDFYFVGDQFEKSDTTTAVDGMIDQDNLTEKLLIKIISEPEDNRIHSLFVYLDHQGDVIRVVRRSDQNQTVFTPADISKGEVVLARASDRDAVLLSCQGCSSQTGGTLNLRYLNNGLTNSYQIFQAQLAREGKEWMMWATDEDGQTHKVVTLRLRSRKVAGTLIGIRKIEINR